MSQETIILIAVFALMVILAGLGYKKETILKILKSTGGLAKRILEILKRK